MTAKRPRPSSQPANATAAKALTKYGKVESGKLVLRSRLLVPDGTQVLVRIEVVESTKPAKPTKVKSPRHLTNAELGEFVKQHPAPQEWWDSTDNPFEP